MIELSNKKWYVYIFVVSVNLSNYRRRHFKLFTICHVSWDTLYLKMCSILLIQCHLFNRFTMEKQFFKFFSEKSLKSTIGNQTSPSIIVESRLQIDNKKTMNIYQNHISKRARRLSFSNHLLLHIFVKKTNNYF